MSRKLLTIGLLIISGSFARAQEPATERKDLNDRIFSLYQKGDFEQAIETGEKLVKLEKSSNDSVSYVNALVKLSRINREYFVVLQNQLVGERRGATERKAISEKIERIGNDAEQLFREALKASEKAGRGESGQVADIKKDLAWIVSNHTYSGVKTVEKSRGRIDESERYLLDAIALNEQVRGRDADETLFAALDAGDFYYKYVNFEKALAFYERFIENYERKHGANHRDLTRGLRAQASILYSTMQEPEAAEIVKRIETITQKNEPMPKAEINLHLRSKDSVAYAAPVILAANEKAKDYRSRLKSEGKTPTANDASAMARMIVVPVKIEIDETGKITKASAQVSNARLATEAESIVAKWTVRPFIYNGTTRKMRGMLFYRKAA